ncbi:Uncharacterised protein [Segatella copri]|nr:Uncharacterised protein [Segatella copri]
MTGRKHRPAVATSLRNKQPLARFQSLHNRQVIDAASCAVREPEAGSFLLLLVIQVPVLDSYKPLHHSPVNLPLLEEKSSSCLVEPGMLEEPSIPACIEGRFPRIITRRRTIG